MFARSLAIFQVDSLYIYTDPTLSGSKADYERRVMKNILSYIETPQYLRRQLFPFHKDLKYAGQLPPLATLHHPIDEIKPKQFREGVVYLNKKNQVLINVGAEEPLRVKNNPGKSLKDTKMRVTAYIHRENNELIAEIVPRKAVEELMYWGYKIKETNNPLSKFNKRDDYFVIGTSKTGENYNNFSLEENLEFKKKYSSKKALLIVFGSPRTGIPNLLKGTGTKTGDIFDAYLNMIPTTGTRSIRLEEAISISLARLLPKFGL